MPGPFDALFNVPGKPARRKAARRTAKGVCLHCGRPEVYRLLGPSGWTLCELDGLYMVPHECDATKNKS